MQKKEILKELIECSQILYKQGDMKNFKKLVMAAEEIQGKVPNNSPREIPNNIPEGTFNNTSGEVTNNTSGEIPDLDSIFNQMSSPRIERLKTGEIPATISVLYSNIEVENLAKAKEAFIKLRDYLREKLNSSNISVEFPRIKEGETQL